MTSLDFKFNKWIFKLYVIFILFDVSLNVDAKICDKENLKIAIIGAGIGGAATSFFLSQLPKANDFCIDIYEANKVGGRLAEVEIDGLRFDTGGCVIHDSNLYMASFLKELGLKKRKHSLNEKLGIYNDKQFIFIESNWNMLNYLKLIWRYGFKVMYMTNYVESILEKFVSIYEYQDKMMSFHNPVDLLKQLSPYFPSYLSISLKDALSKEGFSNRLIDELVNAGLTCDYGQSPDVHQFVGVVTMAGAVGRLWSVDGGQSKVVEELIKTSQANLIHSKVEEISLNSNGSFTIFENNRSKVYDFVVVAAPLTEDAKFPIKFTQFTNSIHIPGRYHRTVSTILQGKINATYFGFSNEEEIPNTIINIDKSLFNSISEIHPVSTEQKTTKKTWKIFSQKPLKPDELDALFVERNHTKVVDWLAYPHYDTKAREDTFVLYNNLFYLNSVEWVASCMEMSAISAKNIALLINNLSTPKKVEYQKKFSKMNHNEL
uniref:Prenylcysteine lyase domain-containing protein n=1 Tax=Clastoptera arizonana TaxID=38151 RepID=A0A1B6CZE3_9HEMI